MALAGWVFDTALAWVTSFKTSAMLQRMPHHAGRQIAHTCPARTNSLVHRAHGTFQLKCLVTTVTTGCCAVPCVVLFRASFRE